MLLEEAYTDCAIMDKRTESDGEGDVTTHWVDGAKIQCAIVLDNSLEARIAQQQGVKNVYTLTTRKAVKLLFNDVIKRLSDGKTFKVTSDGTDKKTPKSSNIDMRQVSAEEIQI